MNCGGKARRGSQCSRWRKRRRRNCPTRKKFLSPASSPVAVVMGLAALLFAGAWHLVAAVIEWLKSVF